MKRTLFLASTLLLMASALIFWNCQKDELTNPNELSIKSGEIVTNFVSWCESPAEYTLIAGQTMNAGKLLVSNNSEFIRIEFVANEGFNLGGVHLWVGTDFTQVPKNKKGIPVPGQFPLKGDATSGYVFYVPVPAGAKCAETQIYIYAHAEMSYVVDGITKTETAWSEGTTFGTSRWGWYSTATLCCQPPAGGGEECIEWQTETAFCGEAEGPGKGAWWFYYDGVGAEKIYAGQNIEIGTVEYVNGKLVISLTGGWELQDVSEPVKIEGYTTLPENRPSAGLFTTYKGSSLNPEVAVFPYYVIHLDVKKCSLWQ